MAQLSYRFHNPIGPILEARELLKKLISCLFCSASFSTPPLGREGARLHGSHPWMHKRYPRLSRAKAALGNASCETFFFVKGTE